MERYQRNQGRNETQINDQGLIQLIKIDEGVEEVKRVIDYSLFNEKENKLCICWTFK